MRQISEADPDIYESESDINEVDPDINEADSDLNEAGQRFRSTCVSTQSYGICFHKY